MSEGARWRRGDLWFATLCSLLWLVPLHAHAYRTAADSPDFAGADRVAWRSYDLRFELASVADATVTDPELRSSVESAMEMWNAAACSQLHMSLAPGIGAPATADDGRNTITLVPALPAASVGVGDTLAFTDLRYARVGSTMDWEIIEADIYVDAARLEARPDPIAALTEVLAHELGHGLGLTHVCSIDTMSTAPACGSTLADAIMDPRYQGVVTGPRADDIAGVCALYPPTCLTRCTAGEVCTLLGCRPACGLSTCDLGERCDAGACVVDEVASSCDAGGCLGLAGDPCAESTECASGYCEPGLGACEDLCVRAECGPRHLCESRGEARVCVSDAGALGAVCAEGVDCASGLCATRGASDGYCTRACDATCPDGFACGSIEGRDICVRHSGGCAVQAPGVSAGGVAWLLWGILGGALWRRRRR